MPDHHDSYHSLNHHYDVLRYLHVSLFLEIVCSADVPCDLNHVCHHGICAPFRDVAKNEDSLLEANSEFDHSVENGEVVDDWPGNDNDFKEPDIGEDDEYDDVAREDDEVFDGDNYSNEEGDHEEESGEEYRKKRGVRYVSYIVAVVQTFTCMRKMKLILLRFFYRLGMITKFNLKMGKMKN